MSSRKIDSHSAAINPRKLTKVARHGPAAWEIATDHERIRCGLEQVTRPFLSLRRTSRLFGTSHHTLLHWEKIGLLKRVRSSAAGLHLKYRVTDLLAFVDLLRNRVVDYPSPVKRFGRPMTYPFDILCKTFPWATCEKSLTPVEIALRIGCHPSTVVRAIISGEVRGRRRTPCRWEIRRVDWQRAFMVPLENQKIPIDTPFGGNALKTLQVVGRGTARPPHRPCRSFTRATFFT